MLLFIFVVSMLISLGIVIGIMSGKAEPQYEICDYYVQPYQTYWQIKMEVYGNAVSWDKAQRWFYEDNGFLPGQIKANQRIFLREIGE